MKVTASALLAFLVVCPVRVSAQIVDSVVVGDPSVNVSLLTAGTDTVDSYKVVGSNRSWLNTNIQTVFEAHDGTRPVIQINSVHFSASGDTTIGSILVLQEDLSLIRHRVKGKNDSAAVAFTENRITGWVVLPGRPVSLIDRVVLHRVFPVDGAAPWFVRALPLSEGYRAVIRRYDPWQDCEVWKSISVVGTEIMKWNGAERNCWKIDGGPLGPPGYKAFYWVDKDSNRILQTALLGPEDNVQYWSVTR